MATFARSVAEDKFWGIAELQEELLKHLDLQSTLRLAQTSKGIRDILQGGLVWRQLLARTSPIRRVSQVKNVCGILKLLTDIEYHLHTVKNEIIRANPCIQAEAGPAEGNYISIMGGGHTESRRVSAEAFMLMEEVDGPLERLEEQVDRIFVSTLSSNLLSAIAARLSRQEEQATEVHILELEVETEREAFETRIMMTSCTPLEFHLSTLVVTEIETEGWKLLASGLEAHTGIQQVHTKKSSLELGHREDLKLIWNAVQEGGRWEVEETDWTAEDSRSEVINKNDEGWARLCEVMELEEGEWLDQMAVREEQEGQDEEVG